MTDWEVRVASDVAAGSDRMESNSDEVTALLTEVLEEFRMSGAQLAEKLGVHRSTVSRWATGARQPNAYFVRCLRDALHEYSQDFADRIESWESRLRQSHLRLLEKERQAQTHESEDGTREVRRRAS